MFAAALGADSPARRRGGPADVQSLTTVLKREFRLAACGAESLRFRDRVRHHEILNCDMQMSYAWVALPVLSWI